MWASTVLVRCPTSGGCWSLQKWDLNYSMQTPARVGGRQLCRRSLRCLWSPCSLSEASFAGVDQLQDSAIFLSIYPSPRVLLQNGHHLWWRPHWPSSWMLEWGLSSLMMWRCCAVTWGFSSWLPLFGDCAPEPTIGGEKSLTTGIKRVVIVSTY